MSKLSALLASAGLAFGLVAGFFAQPAAASAAAGCVPGKPAVLVDVAGFKQPSGRLKVSLYGSDSNRWLVKGGKIDRLTVPVTGKSMKLCLPVPSPGRYALAVHHDLNVNGQRDRQDGGGYSRNPSVTLLNPKPAFARAAFNVGEGPARVQVTLLYVKGLKVGPAEQ